MSRANVPDRLVGDYLTMVDTLLRARKELGRSQKWVAEQIGTAQSALSDIESGQNCTALTLMRIAEVLGLQLRLEPLDPGVPRDGDEALGAQAIQQALNALGLEMVVRPMRVRR